jgi:hypothetical protein
MGHSTPKSAVRCCAVRALALLSLFAAARARAADLPAGFDQIDSSFRAFLQTYSSPGTPIAIAKDGRLVLAKGYGYSDVEQGQATEADSFRFGSIAKSIPAIAVMKLVESGKLSVDSKAFDMLSDIRPRSGRFGDPRIGRLPSGICFRIRAVGTPTKAGARLWRRSASKLHPRWWCRFRPRQRPSLVLYARSAPRFRSRYPVRVFEFGIPDPGACH